jgi:hypothetical protein
LTGTSFPQVEQNQRLRWLQCHFPIGFSPCGAPGLIAVAVLLAASVAIAQTALVQDQSGATGYSSSQAGLSASGLQLSELSLSDSPTPGASALGGGMYGSDSGHTEIFA